MLSEDVLIEKLGRKWKTKVPALKALCKVLDEVYIGTGPLEEKPLSTHSAVLQKPFMEYSNKVKALAGALKDLCKLEILVKTTTEYHYQKGKCIAYKYTYNNTIRF